MLRELLGGWSRRRRGLGRGLSHVLCLALFVLFCSNVVFPVFLVLLFSVLSFFPWDRLQHVAHTGACSREPNGAPHESAITLYNKSMLHDAKGLPEPTSRASCPAVQLPCPQAEAHSPVLPGRPALQLAGACVQEQGAPTQPPLQRPLSPRRLQPMVQPRPHLPLEQVPHRSAVGVVAEDVVAGPARPPSL